MTHVFPTVFPGITQVVTSTTAPTTLTALPTDQSGVAPKAVRVCSTNPVMLRFGIAGQAATPDLNSMLVTSNPDYLEVRGRNAFAAVLHTTNPATSVLSIDPVEQ